jgi:hypothetical protein
MDNFSTLPAKERTAIIQEVSAQRNILPIILEKDFWVCWTLKRLFSIPALADHITFKGGTSLSKAYGVISRFSEDIDLTISKSFLGVNDTNNPTTTNISNNEQERRMDALKLAAQETIATTIVPLLHEQCAFFLGKDDSWSMIIAPDDNDKQTLLFFYPKTQGFGNGAFGMGSFGGTEGYIKPAVRLEFGARGDREPSELKSITPYIAESFPVLFTAPTCDIPTLSIVRTFWEKITALHAFHHGTKHRDRWSRHYYDIHCMAEAGIAVQALKDIALLEEVVKNKTQYFKDNKASYDTAKIGTLQIAPPQSMISELRKDYEAMKEMFMGEYPEFDSVLASLVALQETINQRVI